MKYPCDLVMDLLPLYHDEVCGESSKKIIEEHLAECDSCKSVMAKIDDNTYTDRLAKERETIIGQYTKKVRKKTLLTGICFASVLVIPILVCLIVNLATGHALDWFFIVLTSLMVFASVTVVPLVVERKKGLWTIGSFTASLVLLLLTCCLYTGGDWFFVAVIPALFGLSVLFLPYVVTQLPISGFWEKNKGLLVMLIDTILLYGIIIASGLYSNPADYWRFALLSTSANILFPWVLFVIIRYLKTNTFTKAGLCAIVSGIYVSTVHDVSILIADGVSHLTFTNANLFDWNPKIVNANVYLLILLTGIVAGVILLAIGILRKKSSQNQQSKRR